MSAGAILAIIGMVLSAVFWVAHAMPALYAATFWLALGAILGYGITTNWRRKN